MIYLHRDIVCTLFLQAEGRGRGGVRSWISNQIFEKGGLTGSGFLEEGCGKRRVNFFSRSEELQVLHKKETKIWNFKWQKKFINKKMFIYTKNLNWQILVKNLVTFKDRMGLKIKNFNNMGVQKSLGIRDSQENNI